MQLTVHRGTKEIGGNCVEVATSSTRLIIDVGFPLFAADRQPLDSRSLRRQSKESLLAAGILPKVPGLFVDGPPIDGILLSHAHMDHTGLLDHSFDSIPVYASKGTSKMMDAARFAGQVGLSRNRFRELIPRVPVHIGTFTVTPFPVDHSIYGCFAFLVEAAGKTVLYSGDLRLHGRKPGMARALLAAVAGRPIDLLLMEGTHIRDAVDQRVDESELENVIVDLLTNAPSLVLASFSPQHVDRLVGFIRAAKRTGRTLIVDVYTAYVMHLIQSEVKIPIASRKNGFRVFFFPRIFEETQERKRLSHIGNLFAESQISMDVIRCEPTKFLMVFRPSMTESDFAGNFPAFTQCIFSRWEGYLQSPEWQAVRSKLEDRGGKLVLAHTTGHILAPDILEFVRAIGARTVVPVHTFEPECFCSLVENSRLLRDGETLLVD